MGGFDHNAKCPEAFRDANQVALRKGQGESLSPGYDIMHFVP
jgi:hypothetical protein